MTTSRSEAEARRALADNDVINTATPLELDLLGVHPRLLCVRHPFDTLKNRLATEPWTGWFEDLKRGGESLLTLALPDRLMGIPYSKFDVRGLGGHLITLSLLYRMTGEERYRARVRDLMGRLAREEDWGESLIFGHWAQGFAIALDWLWQDWDDDFRRRQVDILYRRARHVFDRWATYRSGEPFGYTWNISAVVLGGITAAASCLYGEHPEVAPLVNLAWEKMRCQSLALGPDGVSPEGIMYGGYYTSYLTVNFVMAEELFGLDFYGTTPWLAHYAKSLHAQSIPRSAWKSNDVFFMQGDAHGNVFGLEAVLRVIASAGKDGTAQWLADELLRSGKIGTSPISLLLHDPTVRPESPLDRPPHDVMEDHGIVTMRSDWSGTESASAFKCGPNVGHHAARLFRHPLGGGHMYPNNGDLQIFAHGEWILPYPGYVYKMTAYHNTLLIDGAGQYGENSEWMEDLPYRQRHRYPRIERVAHRGGWDEIAADLTEAYPAERGLRRLCRRVIYVRPDLWVLIDTVEADRPVLPTQLFHTGFPVQTEGEGQWVGRGQTAGVRIQSHGITAVQGVTEDQVRRHSGGAEQGTMPLLRISAAAAAARHCLVTSVQAFALSTAPPSGVRVEVVGEKVRIGWKGAAGNAVWTVES